MFDSWLADLTVLIHALFILFVVGGGFVVLHWPRLAWLHLPAALWGGMVELAGWICPLTDLELYWRRRGGEPATTAPLSSTTLSRSSTRQG